MKTILFFATLSLVMWVTLCSNDNQRENDEEEVFEEFLDRVKRDAMPQPRGGSRRGSRARVGGGGGGGYGGSGAAVKISSLLASTCIFGTVVYVASF